MPVTGSQYFAGSPVTIHLSFSGCGGARCGRMCIGTFMLHTSSTTLEESPSRKERYLIIGPSYAFFVAIAFAFVSSSNAIIFARLAMFSISVCAASASSSSCVSNFSSALGFFFIFFSRSIRSFSCFSCSLKASAVRFCVDLRTVRGISTAALCSATRGLARCLDAAAAEGAGRAAGVAALLGALIRTAFLAFLPGTLRAGRFLSFVTSTSSSSSLSSSLLKSESPSSLVSFSLT
mmetsp:Transcript_17998/g.32038  ORF Transcript_17998/g.32038 Transcript_17998/m.32038 type:complete len:235 (-) Transcript_17998:330-1034(-)